MTLIKLQHLSKTYSAGATAFKTELLAISKGSKIGIAGETGSGKSSLLKIIGGLEKPDKGEAFFDSEPIYPKLDRLIPGHPEMAYLSQSFELPKFISVLDFLDNKSVDQEDIRTIAEICRITGLLHKDTRALSGGERQRTALAKVLLKRPQILLLDEPYSNLDPHHKRSMKEVIEKVGEEIEATILMVSHEPVDLLPWADEVLVLRRGEVMQRGKPIDIYNNPKNEYVASLFGEYQILDGEKWNIRKGSVIVRPEQFSVSKNGSTGVVKSVKYLGSNEMLTVEINDELVLMRASVGKYKPGQVIGLEFSNKNKKGSI